MQPVATSKLPHTAPSYRNLSQLPAATWQDATWHEQAEHQKLGRFCSRTTPVHCHSSSSPGTLLTLDHVRVWKNQCHYQDADTVAIFTVNISNIPFSKERVLGGFSCSGHENTSGSGSGIAGLLRTLPCNSASRTESWGRGKCPRPSQPHH